MRLFLFIWATSLLAFLSACTKKGENDPEISLRTRTARLAGDWKLKSGSASFTEDVTAVSFTFDGREFKRFTTYSGGPAVYYYGKYFLQLKINKDGTTSFSELLVSDRIEQSGTWSFNTGNSEFKSKELIAFNFDTPIKGETYRSIFLQGSASFVYRMTALRNKTMTIVAAGSYTGSSGQKVKYTIEYQLEQV